MMLPFITCLFTYLRLTLWDGACFNSIRLNNTKDRLVCKVTSIDRAYSYWDHYMAILQTHFKIWAKSGDKIYFIHKNPFFYPKVSPKEKEGRCLWPLG